MDRLSHLGGLFTDVTEVVLELSGRVEGLLALVALVSSGIGEVAEGTGAYDEPISQPEIAILAVALRHLLLRGLLLLVDIEEYLLGDFGVPLGAGPPEVVESDIEPLVDLGVDLVVEIADLLGGFLLLHGLDLRGRAVLVRPADVEHVGALQLLESREDVRREHAPDDVAQVRHVVDVGQRRCYQHVVLVLAGETGIGLEDDLLGAELFAILLGDFNLFHLGILAWLDLTFRFLLGFRLGLLGGGC